MGPAPHPDLRRSVESKSYGIGSQEYREIAGAQGVPTSPFVGAAVTERDRRAASRRVKTAIRWMVRPGSTNPASCRRGGPAGTIGDMTTAVPSRAAHPVPLGLPTNRAATPAPLTAPETIA